MIFAAVILFVVVAIIVWSTTPHRHRAAAETDQCARMCEKAVPGYKHDAAPTTINYGSTCLGHCTKLRPLDAAGRRAYCSSVTEHSGMRLACEATALMLTESDPCHNASRSFSWCMKRARDHSLPAASLSASIRK